MPPLLTCAVALGTLTAPTVSISRPGSAQAADSGNLATLRSTGDCSRCDLRSASLSGADLRDADLSRSDLRYANLRNANLRGANLYLADLNRADLRGATWTDGSECSDESCGGKAY
ncbi:MAG: pentapeptide repeat-containing protein [Cyanobacteria bacterium P01_A01_bin.135]